MRQRGLASMVGCGIGGLSIEMPRAFSNAILIIGGEAERGLMSGEGRKMPPFFHVVRWR
jgi:hypothetical protein